jgi:PLP dependent protein
MYESRLSDTLGPVRERIDRALERAGRSGQVRIVAVTKGHTVEAVRAALGVGLTSMGENRVQELEEKVGAAGRSGVEWHMIGHLQRNKARLAVDLSDWIHSVDSLRLARALSNEAVRAGFRVRGLLQVNVSGEEAKGGFEADEAMDALGALGELSGLEIHGLMTMAPWTSDQAVLRSTFARTRALLERCRRELPGALRGNELSMGMSNDFEIAVEEGATMVRLGTVLFGEREQS